MKAILFFACLLAAAVTRHSHAGHDESRDAVLSAIQQRRTSVPRFRCTVNWVRLTDPEVFGGSRATPGDSLNGDAAPLLIESQFQYAIELSSPRLRVEERGQTFSQVTKSLVPKFAITLFDGQRGFYLHPEEASHGKVVNYSELTGDSTALTHFASPPLLWPFGIIGRADFRLGQVTSLTGPDCLWEADGERCKLTRTGTSLRSTYTFDPAFGNNVVHCEVRRIDDPSSRVSEYNVRYEQTAHGWLPASWDVVHGDLSTQTYKATDWDVPTGFDPKEFVPPEDFLQPGMTVITPGERIKVVTPDGSLVNYRSGAPLQRDSWRSAILIGAGVILCVLAVWCIRRW